MSNDDPSTSNDDALRLPVEGFCLRGDPRPDDVEARSMADAEKGERRPFEGSKRHAIDDGLREKDDDDPSRDPGDTLFGDGAQMSGEGDLSKACARWGSVVRAEEGSTTPRRRIGGMCSRWRAPHEGQPMALYA
jgi:hypothetical protein